MNFLPTAMWYLFKPWRWYSMCLYLIRRVILVPTPYAACNCSKNTTSSIFTISVSNSTCLKDSIPWCIWWQSVIRITTIAKVLICKIDLLFLLINILISFWNLLKLSNKLENNSITFFLFNKVCKLNSFLMYSKCKRNDTFTLHLNNIKIFDLIIFSKLLDLNKFVAVFNSMYNKLRSMTGH